MCSPATEPKPASRMTIVQECPVTRRQHSFMINKDHLLSSESLEEIARDIRDSDPLDLAIERSRTLMEVVYKLVRWERGLLAKHPLLPAVGPYADTKKRKLGQ